MLQSRTGCGHRGGGCSCSAQKMSTEGQQLPACLQQHQKHTGLGFPPAVEKNPATILSAFCQVLTSWSMGSGIKCSACSHRICPAKEKCFLCFLLQAGRTRWLFKTIALWGKRISFHSKTQRWVVRSCPKQTLAGMGVGGHLHGGGSQETLVGSARAGMGSYLADPGGIGPA